MYGAVTRYGRTFQTVLLWCLLPRLSPTTPHLPQQIWFRLFPVRSPLLGESLLFSFPAGTKMFQFPALAPLCGDMPSAYQVVPFGNLRFKGYLLLDAAYRSLSRPSSPPRAKASTVCPFVLFFIYRPFARSGRIYYKLLYSLLFLYNMSMIEI